MGKNTEFSERLWQIVDFLDVNRSEFARILGYNRAQTVYDLMNGDSKPSFDFFERFFNTELSVKINSDWLFTGKGEMINSIDEKTNSNPSFTPKVITVDNQGRENIPMVPVPAQAGYLNNYNDESFIKDLPSYNLPSLKNGTFRMFEVKGHSMYPTLHAGAFAVGQFVENWNRDIIDNRIYIIVHQEDGVVVKRCLNRFEKYGNIFLKSDNRTEYPSYPVKANEVKEVWELKTALIFNFQDPADLYSRVSELEAEILQIKSEKLK